MTKRIEAPHPAAHRTADRHDLEAHTPWALPARRAAMQGTDREPANDWPRFTPAPVAACEHPPVRERAPSRDTRRHILATPAQAGRARPRLSPTRR